MGEGARSPLGTLTSSDGRPRARLVRMIGPRLRGLRRALPLTAAVLATAGSLAGCSGRTAGSGDLPQVSPELAITQFQAAQRVHAPEMSGPTIAGGTYTTSYTGHVTVINIWGSWCPHCREEAPALAEASKDYASKGVLFLGIDAEDDDASARSYASSYGITYPSLADPDERFLLDLKSFVPAEGVPSTLIVDAGGKVAVRVIGGITEPELDQELNYVLAG